MVFVRAVIIGLCVAAALRVQAQDLDRAALESPGASNGMVSAQLAEARRVFEAGKAAFDAGRFDEAAERFERAYELSGRPELLFDLGLAADRLRDDERALDAFERYLALAGDSPFRAQVERRVAALRAARARERWARERERERVQAEVAGLPPVAPSPVQVAAAAPRSAAIELDAAPRTPAPRDDAAHDDGGSVLSEWWFWTAAVVVIAGGAATAYVLARDDDPRPLPQPTSGVVVSTLRIAP